MPDHHYHRKMPHFQPAEATFFVTFRLADSMPMDVIRRLRENYDLMQKGILEQKDLTEREQRELVYAEQKRLFAATDDFLDKSLNEPYWLKETEVAEVVAEALLFYDGKDYDLWSFCIMPNHVHLLLTLKPEAPVLFKVLQRIKRYTSLKCNEILFREGAFWEQESYDHIVRSDHEFDRILHYILQNPVKAGLVKNWEDWLFTYCRAEVRSTF